MIIYCGDNSNKQGHIHVCSHIDTFIEPVALNYSKLKFESISINNRKTCIIYTI